MLLQLTTEVILTISLAIIMVLLAIFMYLILSSISGRVSKGDVDLFGKLKKKKKEKRY